MAKLEHFSHECTLTSPEIAVYGVCNVCYKDELVEYSCNSCNFDLCKTCSKLPRRVSHDFHPEHPLDFCLRQYDRKPGCIVCSGCGNMSSCSFYECKECEVYLDLGCALMENIFRGWEAEEMLHYSHAHLLRRCRPGPDVVGSSCLLCDLPLSPSAICYGCVHCYSFLHERCLDLPTEIQHPVHPAHPLKRLDYTQTCGDGRYCDACGFNIASVPFGCLECDFDIHTRCADSLLRGLVHECHEHILFYVANETCSPFGKIGPCQICMRTDIISLDSYYYCVECGLKFHFECLDIPESVSKKSYHIHPLVCKIFVAENNSLEYCGVCETMVYEGYHAYSCKECDFVGHIECILRKEEPSPLYLKDLYSYNKENTRPVDREDCETNQLGIKLLVHLMRPVHMSELDKRKKCNICRGKILGSPYKCETCSFQTHHFCAELGQPSRHQLHWNHPLTLLPNPSACNKMECDICGNDINGFYLFCRICNFIIDIICGLKGKHAFGESGQKIIGTWRGHCMSGTHDLIQVIVSRSYLVSCSICYESLYGKALSCMMCGDIYHPRCIEDRRQGLFGHPLHSDHKLNFSITSGSKCIACKENIAKYGYRCQPCGVNFHIQCTEAASMSGKIWSHSHNLYNFWIDDSRLTLTCSVCAQTCDASFYGCIDCNFNAHIECIGFPDNVKNQKHQHTVTQKPSYDWRNCSLCGLSCYSSIYSCNHCEEVFHIECIMSTDVREAATEEEQIRDIYLMYVERHLFDMFEGSTS